MKPAQIHASRLDGATHTEGTMPAVTNAQILAALTALGARIDAIESAPVVGAPAAAKADAPAKFVKGKRDKAGNVAGGFPCEVDKTCGRVLRYAERAKFHGTERGHEFRPR